MIHKISFFILCFAICPDGIKTARSLGNRSADQITQKSTAGTNVNNRFDDPDIHTNVVSADFLHLLFK